MYRQTDYFWKNDYLGEIKISLTGASDQTQFKMHQVGDELKNELKPNPFIDFIHQHKNKLTSIQEQEQNEMFQASSDQLKVRYITPDLFADWQDQATLVCRVPELRGHDAQILVACDYRDPDDIAAADAGEMLEFVEEFCDTTEGKRVIRSGKQPDLEEVTDWISFAQSSRRLRAA